MQLDLKSEPGGFSTDKAQLQENFLHWKFGMFLHFNMATFHGVEWATGYEDPKSFAPDMLDCNQWAKAAVSAGMKYAVLTVKHTGGWCLWRSELTPTHSMSAFVNYQDGEGDILREFTDACRKHGLHVGIYYCFPRDLFGCVEGKDPLYGLPPEAGADQLEFIKNQLTELLSNYGAIDLIWCDQYQFMINQYWPEIVAHIKSRQSNCLVIANNSTDDRETDIHSYEYPWLMAKKRDPLPPVDNMYAAEVCDFIAPGWFWEDDMNASKLKTVDEVVNRLRLCNDRNANYLLNVSPDRNGLIPDYAVERLAEIGSCLS
jgi:alpha-L-fucosidase